MGNVTENDIIMFAFEFFKEVCKVNQELLVFSDFKLRWEDSVLNLRDFLAVDPIDEISTDEVFDYVWSPDEDEPDINDLAADESISGRRTAVLSISGDLYDTLYNYEGMGAGGKKAEKIYNAMNSIACKYGLFASLSCAGMVALYELHSD